MLSRLRCSPKTSSDTDALRTEHRSSESSHQQHTTKTTEEARREEERTEREPAEQVARRDVTPSSGARVMKGCGAYVTSARARGLTGSPHGCTFGPARSLTGGPVSTAGGRSLAGRGLPCCAGVLHVSQVVALVRWWCSSRPTTTL